MNRLYMDKMEFIQNCKDEYCDGTYEDFIHKTTNGSLVCSICGEIQILRMAVDKDWNNYSDEQGVFKDNSRVGWTDPNNPFDEAGSNAIIISLKSGKNKIIHKTNFNSKQRAFWNVSKMLMDKAQTHGITDSVVNNTKRIWGELMKSKKTNRGGVRKGIISCCLLSAFKVCNAPRSREEVAKIMGIPVSDITKGEPIFRDLIKETKYKNLLEEEDNTAILITRYLSLLGLPLKFSKRCREIHKELEEELEEVAPKSGIAGVITHVIKVEQKLKVPSKKKITEVIQICNPTLNKVLKLIKNNL